MSSIGPDGPAGFPSAEKLAEMEGESVPAAGLALVPEVPEARLRKPTTIVALAGAAFAAGIGLYRHLLALTKAH